jgi:hypothetical protein
MPKDENMLPLTCVYMVNIQDRWIVTIPSISPPILGLRLWITAAGWRHFLHKPKKLSKSPSFFLFLQPTTETFLHPFFLL